MNIEQRAIDDEVYTITILKSLTDKDRIDLEEGIKSLQKHKDCSRIHSSKFIIVNTHKTKEEIEEINNQDKIQDLFRVYKENNSQEYQIEDNTLIDEVNNLKLTDKNKKEINKKINLINDSIKELEEYRKKMETIIAK
jgi:hypothetical protein